MRRRIVAYHGGGPDVPFRRCSILIWLDPDPVEVEVESVGPATYPSGHFVDLLWRHTAGVDGHRVGLAILVRSQHRDTVAEDDDRLGRSDSLRGAVQAEDRVGAAVEAGIGRDHPHGPGRAQMRAETRETEHAALAVPDREHDSRAEVRMDPSPRRDPREPGRDH